MNFDLPLDFYAHVTSIFSRCEVKRENVVLATCDLNCGYVVYARVNLYAVCVSNHSTSQSRTGKTCLISISFIMSLFLYTLL